MDFNLSEEELELKQMAREFAQKRLYPRAMELDEESTTPKELIQETAELGYFGFTVPEQYGGLGLSTTSFMGVLEELCGGCAGFGIMLSVHNSLTCEIIKLFGCDDLKQKYLPAMAAGEKIGAVLHHRAERGYRCSVVVDFGSRRRRSLDNKRD